MATDDERREVARRLRELEICSFDDGGYIDSGEVEYALGLVCDDGAWYEAEGVMRLADLIEPQTSEQTNPRESSLSAIPIDRDALLEEVKELGRCAWYFSLDFDEDEPLRDRLKEASEDFAGCASRIREALGVRDG